MKVPNVKISWYRVSFGPGQARVPVEERSSIRVTFGDHDHDSEAQAGYIRRSGRPCPSPLPIIFWVCGRRLYNR